LVRLPNKLISCICTKCSNSFTLRRSTKTPICPSCLKVKATERAKKSKYYQLPIYKAKARQWRLKTYYGLSEEDFNTMSERQGKACAICSKVEPLVVDHDHSTGKVRGLLCHKCNRAIGSLGDNLSLVRKASTYLFRHDPKRSWDQYFIEFAKLTATRSKDPSTQVGSVIVMDRVILSTGYNGFPRGINDNIPERYDRPLKYKFMIHAEENAILNAARFGTSVLGASLYLYPLPPCSECAKAIVQSGIREVIFSHESLNSRYIEDFEISKEILSLSHVLLRSPD